MNLSIYCENYDFLQRMQQGNSLELKTKSLVEVLILGMVLKKKRMNTMYLVALFWVAIALMATSNFLHQNYCQKHVFWSLRAFSITLSYPKHHITHRQPPEAWANEVLKISTG